ncbi:MAG: hypothetical protein QOF51_3392 [Chloroflexota bacterium]|jgi:cell division protein FtsW (lipid II flippase)|nr:hypothetical protein [Chloroflexota bacterium]
MTRALRSLERGLLVYPLLLLAAAEALLVGVRGEPLRPSVMLTIGAFAGLLLLVHIVLVTRLGRADQALLPIVGMLVALGLIAVDRLEPGLVSRQSLWVGIGVVALLATALGLPSVSWLGRYRYTWLFLGLTILAGTILFGVDPNGSGVRIWFGFGGYYFQPAEVMKIVLVIFFASYLAEKRLLITHAPPRVGRLTLPPLTYLAPIVTMCLLAMALLIWQRDLGPALLFYLVFLAMLYAATGRRYIGVGLVFLVLGGVLADHLFAHVQLRTQIWLDPWPYAQDEAYQLIQALTAYAAGGVIGSGLGYGYPEYVPAVHTDFVLAALGEELGLIGTLAIVALYLALVHRAFHIALRAPTDFAALVAAGLGAVLGIQAFIIVAGNLRILPLTGITLPFISYGGSSILANFIMIGLLLRISAESPAAP